MRLIVKLALVAGLFLTALLLFPATAFAQTAQPLVRLDNSGCPAAEPAKFNTTFPDSVSATVGSRLNESPDVVLLATVQADQVRFAKQPEIRVRLCWGGDSLRVIERTNLPSPIVAGTTYRNVFINLEILGHVNAACLASKITNSPADSTAKGSCAGLTVGVQK